MAALPISTRELGVIIDNSLISKLDFSLANRNVNPDHHKNVDDKFAYKMRHLTLFRSIGITLPRRNIIVYIYDRSPVDKNRYKQSC